MHNYTLRKGMGYWRLTGRLVRMQMVKKDAEVKLSGKTQKYGCIDLHHAMIGKEEGYVILNTLQKGS